MLVDPGRFLFVSYRPRPAGITRRFERVELVETVAVPLAAGLERTHWLFELRGFRGYARAHRGGAPRRLSRRAPTRSAARPAAD